VSTARYGLTVYYLVALSLFRRSAADLSPRRPGAQSHTSPCAICGGRSGTGIGFSPSNLVSPVTLIPATLHNNLQTAKVPIRLKKQRSFVRSLDRKLLSVLVVFKGSTDVCFQVGLDIGFNWNAAEVVKNLWKCTSTPPCASYD